MSLYRTAFPHQTTTMRGFDAFAGALYLTVFLHQTTTAKCPHGPCPLLYLIAFPHQTTTISSIRIAAAELYLTVFPHQTTTIAEARSTASRLYLTVFPHQTTLCQARQYCRSSCISPSFHIKPQPQAPDTLIFGCLSCDRHDKKRIGAHRGSRFDAVSASVSKVINLPTRYAFPARKARRAAAPPLRQGASRVPFHPVPTDISPAGTQPAPIRIAFFHYLYP